MGVFLWLCGAVTSRQSGVQCNAYRVWKEDYCFFHLHHRKPAPPVIRNTEAPPPPQGPVIIPLLEDMTSVQLTVTQVLSALAAGTIDSRTAMPASVASVSPPATLPPTRSIP